LQPGYALIIRADRKVDTVAIGDPRIVSAAPVRRGTDVFDVVLQPQSDAGKTNMVIWLGEITTIWDLDVGPAHRTTDVVFVIAPPRTTAGDTVRPDASAINGSTAPNSVAPHGGPRAVPAVTRAPQGATSSATPIPPSQQPGRDVTRPAQTATGSSSASILEVRESAGPVEATLQAGRTKRWIVLRYAITNASETDLAIRSNTVLIRADGRPVAFGMLRTPVDQHRPDVIPRGATETGQIAVATPAARQIELILSLLPLSTSAVPSTEPHIPAGPETNAVSIQAIPVPLVLQATFSRLDRLPVTVLF
jgi:hypothetical protein